MGNKNSVPRRNNYTLRHNSKNKENEIPKFILLGGGDSGKSTFLKNIRIIHGCGYYKEECQSFTDIIHDNIVLSMLYLIRASKKLNIPIQPENQTSADHIYELFYNSEARLNIRRYYTPEVVAHLKKLWSDVGIQATYERRSEFQLIESTQYFHTHIDRISRDDYIPTLEDVLRAKVKTTGIIDHSFEGADYKFRMVDTGGQRNERKKWIFTFRGKPYVIFFVAMSEFDQKCYEDDETNRTMESLLLFDEIINSTWFSESMVFLVFTKVDIFEEKLKTTDLSVCFPDYTGGNDYRYAAKFLVEKYLSICKRHLLNQSIFTYMVNATDTSAVEKIFEDIKYRVMYHMPVFVGDASANRRLFDSLKSQYFTDIEIVF